MPFAAMRRTQTPMSLYAATKGPTELMGRSYSHLFGTPMTFFRFFTVEGPWRRPGDVPATEASHDLLKALIGRAPATPASVEVPEFVRWYRDYYAVSAAAAR